MFAETEPDSDRTGIIEIYDFETLARFSFGVVIY